MRFCALSAGIFAATNRVVRVLANKEKTGKRL
jgi:hypothetical protein